MKLKNIDTAISINIAEIEFAAQIRGTTPLVPGLPLGYTAYLYAGIPDHALTTLFAAYYKIEDVGFLEVMDIRFIAEFYYIGDGSISFELSGDGGITWNPCGKGAFNTAGYTFNAFLGAGLWLSSIESGDNKFGFRINVLSNTGVSFILFDNVNVYITYRKRTF